MLTGVEKGTRDFDYNIFVITFMMSESVLEGFQLKHENMLKSELSFPRVNNIIRSDKDICSSWICGWKVLKNCFVVLSRATTEANIWGSPIHLYNPRGTHEQETLQKIWFYLVQEVPKCKRGKIKKLVKISYDRVQGSDLFDVLWHSMRKKIEVTLNSLRSSCLIKWKKRWMSYALFTRIYRSSLDCIALSPIFIITDGSGR